MFEEMLPEDTKYLEEILTLFKVSKYKLSETPTRFKIIIHPDEFHMQALHDVQDIRTPVGIEVDLKNGVFLECLKTGAARKRRRITMHPFKGEIPEKYKSGRFDPAVRVIMSIEDICEFETDVEGDKLVIKGIECLSYPILKQIEQEGFNIFVSIKKAFISITRAQLH